LWRREAAVGEVSEAGFVRADFVASEADLAVSTALDMLRRVGEEGKVRE
jgi:hypothetical protein